eukprot:CAMPEP_0172827402 /NCGR_PEP_ID=MMETSP1075-20121228/20092_1 /TAXON_ID=2916 /ORGANISM="Ceratium fusus, Strain PA161109" /LENGTH=65 /DNA_ID=CAMNT_0013669209 /DNA_START=43 /DNA_END=237 /DNA_ORIENTATION=-
MAARILDFSCSASARSASLSPAPMSSSPAKAPSPASSLGIPDWLSIKLLLVLNAENAPETCETCI